MGGGGEEILKNFYVRDWRSYKLQDAPQLLEIQNRLHKEGLHDPWMRNYVWMYSKENYIPPIRGMLSSMKHGLKTALALMAVTIVVRKLNEKYRFFGSPHDPKHH